MANTSGQSQQSRLNAQLTELLGHSLGDGHGGDTPGLRAADDAAAREAHLGHVLRHLRRLAGPGLSDHHQNAVPNYA